jgi:hypothetical protein
MFRADLLQLIAADLPGQYLSKDLVGFAGARWLAFPGPGQQQRTQRLVDLQQPRAARLVCAGVDPLLLCELLDDLPGAFLPLGSGEGPVWVDDGLEHPRGEAAEERRCRQHCTQARWVELGHDPGVDVCVAPG